MSSANELLLKTDCAFDVVTQTILSASVQSASHNLVAGRIACATTESPMVIRQEIRANDDDASDDVALLFAAIFGVVRL